MAITLTPVQVGTRDIAGAQTADSIDVADGAVSPALGGHYRIFASTSSVIRIGDNPTDATGGEPWSASAYEYRFIPAGFKIACDAGA